MDDLISRQAALDALKALEEPAPTARHLSAIYDCEDEITSLPPAQPIFLTAEDIETIRIHLSAFKEKLCNQGRWAEAAEYERLIQRLTGEGGQDE